MIHESNKLYIFYQQLLLILSKTVKICVYACVCVFGFFMPKNADMNTYNSTLSIMK